MRKLIKAFFLISLLLLTVYVLKKNINDIPSIQNMNVMGIVGCFVSYTIFILIAAKRYLIFLRKFGLNTIKFSEWFKVYVIGRFFNKFIPQGGNIYRAMVLKSSHKFAYANYTSSLFAFQWVETLMSLSISLIILLLLYPYKMFGSVRATTIIALVLLLALSGPFIMNYLLKTIKIQGGKISEVKEICNKIIVLFFTGFKDINFVIKIIGYGLLSIFAMTIIFYFSFYVLNITPGLANLFIYVSLTRLILIYHFVPGNLGVQELFYGYLTVETGIGLGVGIVISIIMRITTYFILGCFTIGFGGVSLWKDILYLKKEKTGSHFS